MDLKKEMRWVRHRTDEALQFKHHGSDGKGACCANAKQGFPMNNSQFDDQALSYTRASQHACPLCSAKLVRMPRRTIDHFLSRFVPVQRYRCERFVCQWQGNLRVEALPGSAGGNALPTEF
jgi:hypothetical protein